MSLHNGIDTIAIASMGTFTKNYGSTEPNNIANLFASFGYFENAPEEVIGLLRFIQTSFVNIFCCH